MRSGARRDIPFRAEHAAALDAETRALVGRSWLARMKQEHLAVAAFAQLSYETAQVGCEPIVSTLLARAVSDEVRHAEICGKYAALFLGDAAVPTRLAGVPRTPRHQGHTPRERALLHVVEMCCFNETFTGIGFTEMLERATTDTARATLESLLEDEIDHGKVGWAHLAACCAEGWGAAVVSRALPGIVARSVLPVVDPKRGRDLPSRAAYENAYLAPADGARIYARGLRDVVFPGLAALGVDLSAADAFARGHDL
jgi:hypothetical protein